jgi:hypothetical protein
MSGQNGITNARPGTKQVISASTTTAKATNAVGAYTQLVYVFNHATATAYVDFGLTGGAATAATGFPLAAGTGAYLKIGESQFVHAILASSTGNVDVIEMFN